MSDNKTLSLDEQQYKELTGSKAMEEDSDTLLAKVLASPIVNSAQTSHRFLEVENADQKVFLQEISKQAGIVANTDNMDFGIKMLVSQAKALDTLFNALARRAGNNMGHYVDTVNTYMKLALKAQAQSRCTWEAISKIKNPPNATFVKQANIAHGYQQVNNGPNTTANNRASREEKNQNRPNELLEEQQSEQLDTGTQTAASRTDKDMETVATVNRPKN